MDSITNDGSKTLVGTREIMCYREVYAKKSIIYKGIKRLFDITASLIALILLSPVFILTALAIILKDGGPVFFVQDRAGKDMKPFKMYKFRSMCKNAEELFKQMQEQNEQTGHAKERTVSSPFIGKFITILHEEHWRKRVITFPFF